MSTVEVTKVKQHFLFAHAFVFLKGQNIFFHVMCAMYV
jgi:hypothetical protein